MITEEQMAEAIAASVDLVPPTAVTPVTPEDGWSLPPSDSMVRYPTAAGDITVRIRITPQPVETFGVRAVALTGALVDASGYVQREGDRLCLTPSILASGTTVEQLRAEADAASRHVCLLIAQGLELAAWPVAYTAEQQARATALASARQQLRFAIASGLSAWLDDWSAAEARLADVPERLHGDVLQRYEDRARDLTALLGISGDFRSGIAAIVAEGEPDHEAALRAITL
jgi:hypothetical protein